MTIVNNESIKISEVSISARRWFQKSYGNTYFSLEVAVIFDGKRQYENIIEIPFEYGYGDTFNCVALEKFIELFPILDPGKHSNGLRKFCYLSSLLESVGIPCVVNVRDVKRKKDLHKFN